MNNIIGRIHNITDLSNNQIINAENAIKKRLQLNSVEINRVDNEFYLVTTNDESIIDFKLDFSDNDVTLIKYTTLNDEMKEDPYGAILTWSEIKKE